MGSLSIRARILIFQVIIAGAVLLMAAASFVSVRSFDYYFARATLSHQQLEAITELAVHANRYSEQIAELLLVGAPERPDIQSAARELERGFDRLEQSNQVETGFLRQYGLPGGEGEAERLDRMRQLYREIALRVEDLFGMRQAGRLTEAIALFRSDIENRLDAEFEQIISRAVTAEIEEVDEADLQAKTVATILTTVVAITALLVFAVSLTSGYVLYRSLARPIQRLTAGAIAIGHGDLGYRVGSMGGDELGLLATRFDEMTSQIESQQALLLSARSRLEEEVRQRTSEIEEANSRLRSLDRLRVQFLADISHELRTPLTVLRGEAEVTLRRGDLPTESYRLVLGLIVDQAADMGRLVDDLMFLARSETDDIPFDESVFDLSELLGDVVRETGSLGRARRIRIEPERVDANLTIRGDVHRTKQALIIVLENALKYSDPGGVVTVGLRREDGSATLSMRNGGAGISGEDLPYVFDRFYRGRSPGAQVASGSGLGLPIAKWIIEKHAGVITLTSAPGRDTDVTIRLPLVGPEAARGMLEEAAW